MSMILAPEAVNEYLERNGLTEGYAPIEAVLLQTEGATASGQPCVQFAIRLPDGKLVLAKTTLNLFRAAVTAVEGRLAFMRGEHG
jgi:hypothetical protein